MIYALENTYKLLNIIVKKFIKCCLGFDRARGDVKQ